MSVSDFMSNKFIQCEINMDVVDGYAFSQEEHGIMSQVVLVQYAPFFH